MQASQLQSVDSRTIYTCTTRAGRARTASARCCCCCCGCRSRGCCCRGFRASFAIFDLSVSSANISISVKFVVVIVIVVIGGVDDALSVAARAPLCRRACKFACLLLRRQRARAMASVMSVCEGVCAHVRRSTPVKRMLCSIRVYTTHTRARERTNEPINARRHASKQEQMQAGRQAGKQAGRHTRANKLPASVPLQS